MQPAAKDDLTSMLSKAPIIFPFDCPVIISKMDASSLHKRACA
jgi:hypothetical protein